MKQPTKLNNAAIRHLRGLGHGLDPVISIGKSGLTDGLVEETKRALLSHELIKVRVHTEAPVERAEAATLLAEATTASLAQVLGRTFLLYKRHPEKAKIVLPKGRPAPTVTSVTASPARQPAVAPAANTPAVTADPAEDDGDYDDLGGEDEDGTLDGDEN